MLYFQNDYLQGAHPKVLAALVQTNHEVHSGYGTDTITERAKLKIQQACQCPQAQVHFLVGGTQTNAVVINALLQDYQGVIAVSTGHINTHEAGAIEFTKHKVLTLPHHEGKMQAEDLAQYLRGFYQDEARVHMVQPGMVYISQPTEYGTLYSKSELQALYDLCRLYQLPLFIDGARLGYGVMADNADVTLADIAQLCDVFYIGGTKVGAMFGEAVVFTKRNQPPHFVTMIKQHGALLAKGRLLGVQFDALFTDDLYLTISRHAINLAMQLKQILKDKGYRLYIDSPTNQQFVLMTADQMNRLSQHVQMTDWEKYDDTYRIVRFATSWSTTMEDIRALENLL